MLYTEIGPVRPFIPSFGVYPTTTMKYTFIVDMKGNLLIQSQVTTHPNNAPSIPGVWVTEVSIQDNLPIPREMMSILYKLLDDNVVYLTSHWTFVIETIKRIKEKSSEQYQDVYLKNQRLEEEIEVLKAQKEQLMRRLHTYER
jgi:hypothetical protein